MNADDLSPDDAELVRALRASRVLHDAPESVLQRAIGLFDAHARVPLPAGEGGAVRRLLAALRFDSAGQSPLAFGRRSGGASLRQLLYTVEGRDVDLRVVPAAELGRYALSGQVLGPDTRGQVQLFDLDGEPVASAALSDLGEFQLPPVGAGRYTMNLALGGVLIELPPVHLPLPA